MGTQTTFWLTPPHFSKNCGQWTFPQFLAETIAVATILAVVFGELLNQALAERYGKLPLEIQNPPPPPPTSTNVRHTQRFFAQSEPVAHCNRLYL